MHVRGMEMGQHLPIFCVGSNMIYDDGTPYDPRYPEGFAGWLNIVLAMIDTIIFDLGGSL